MCHQQGQLLLDFYKSYSLLIANGCHLPVVATFYSNVECDNDKPPIKSIQDHNFINYVFNDGLQQETLIC